MKRIAIIAALVLLTGCKTDVIYRDRPVEVAVPVTVSCVTTRPAPVVPLRERVPDDAWNALDLRQKAAWVARQGLDRMTYGEDLEAATGGCR